MAEREVRASLETIEAAAPRQETEALSARLLQETPEFAQLLSGLAAIQSGGPSLSVPVALVASPSAEPPAISRSEFEELRAEVTTLKLHAIHPLFSPRGRPFDLTRLIATGFSSLIVAQFPAVFAEFRGKRFTLLCRGSRDGFRAKDFHIRCDGHANTLTFIEDTKGNIFGIFTPVEWDSRLPLENLWLCYKVDLSLRNFLFTLKNPNSFPASTFALKPERKERAIICNSFFLSACDDIIVYDDCNANARSFTSLGGSYVNNTCVDGEAFFTGSKYFTAKEIEVFEVRD
jgi:hypothetical protein